MIEEMFEGNPGKPGMSSDEQKKHHDAAMRLSTLIFDVFNTPVGEKLLDILDGRYLRQPVWAPGAQAGYAEFRAGQNDVVMGIKNCVQAGKDGKLSSPEGSNQK